MRFFFNKESAEDDIFVGLNPTLVLRRVVAAVSTIDMTAWVP